jgi:hypothetical protein
MENSKDFLYSLAPLVLIIVFSWLFSFLGSKMKKQGQGAAPQSQREPQGDLIDLFPDAGRQGSPGQPGTEQATWGQGRPADVTTWNSRTAGGPPPVTAAPIKPKWWGA